MNRKRFAIVMTVGMMLLAILLWAGPALAISNGEPDGDGHPNVGMIWADVPDVGLVPVCSGVKVELAFRLQTRPTWRGFFVSNDIARTDKAHWPQMPHIVYNG